MLSSQFVSNLNLGIFSVCCHYRLISGAALATGSDAVGVGTWGVGLRTIKNNGAIKIRQYPVTQTLKHSDLQGCSTVVPDTPPLTYLKYSFSCNLGA